MYLKDLAIIGLIALLGGCISIETTNSQEVKEPRAQQKFSRESPSTVRRIIIRDSTKVTSTEESAPKTNGRYLSLGDTVRIKSPDEIPEAQVYRGEATLYEEGEPVGKVNESSIGVIEGFMRAKEASFTYSKRDTTSETESKLKKGKRVAVRNFRRGFYNLTVKYDEFIPSDKLVSETKYWNTLATTYDVWTDMLWREIYSENSLFVGDSWSWAENFDESKNIESLSFIYELRVDRIKWDRLSDYKREGVLGNSYNKLKKRYYDFEKDAEYCPVIIFKIDGPSIQETKVAESSCEDAWYRGRP